MLLLYNKMKRKWGNTFRNILYPVLLLTPLTVASCRPTADTETHWKKQREIMVETQIEARGIRNANVLKALRTVPRHRFVPEKYRRYAYADSPLPIGADQTISQPYIVALMTELAALKKSAKVLEIGTGSGYQAAVLAEICDSVFTVEINATLSQTAQRVTAELGYRNICFRIGDGYAGWAEHAPYDAIIITCAPSELPETLVFQLCDGGTIVVPLGQTYEQNLYVYKKAGNNILVDRIIPVRFVPMIDSTGSLY
ncbi:MAG: protein-L-isoaspartate(D-aspartate) O-methyltransferase [Fidelibacterota bacterium]